MNYLHNIELLDKNDPASIHEYEHALYRAFSKSYIKTLHYIWDIDHIGKKIKTKVTYHGQEIFVIKMGEKIIAAIAINHGINDLFQLEMMGFKFDKSNNVCEVLHIFNLYDATEGITIMKSLSTYVLNNLKLRGIKLIYGTCSEKRLRSYKFIGFNTINQHHFNGENKYLLEMKLHNT
jgi:hypothetical protein